jgi:DNA repair protein RecO (recombination protein O)
MALTRTEAVILHATDYSDTSRIFRLYSRDYGLQSIIAKGIRRSGHKLTGVLETLNHVEVLYYKRPGRDLFTLSQASCIESFSGLSRDIHRYYRAAVIAEMVLKMGAVEECSPALFRVLVRALRALSRRPISTLGVRMYAYAWEILNLLGYAPRLDTCVNCGTPADGAEIARFSIEEGGVLCGRCRVGTGRGTIGLTRNVRRVIDAGENGPPNRLTLDDEQTLFRLTDDYIRYHVQGQRPLLSWEFLRALKV